MAIIKIDFTDQLYRFYNILILQLFLELHSSRSIYNIIIIIKINVIPLLYQMIYIHKINYEENNKFRVNKLQNKIHDFSK